MANTTRNFDVYGVEQTFTAVPVRQINRRNQTNSEGNNPLKDKGFFDYLTPGSFCLFWTVITFLAYILCFGIALLILIVDLPFICGAYNDTCKTK